MLLLEKMALSKHNSLHAGKFCMLFCHLLFFVWFFFLKLLFLKKNASGIPSVSNSLDSDQRDSLTARVISR